MKRVHGSPPRMRGKLGEALFKLRVARITPAHAGKTHRGHGEGD